MVSGVNAGCFNGSQVFICSVTTISECDFGEPCETVNPLDINAPAFLKIDLNQGIIFPAEAGVDFGKRKSIIQNKRIVDEKLFLQGAEDGIGKEKDGAGWTVAISQETGRMILTVSTDDTGFVASGNCICNLSMKKTRYKNNKMMDKKCPCKNRKSDCMKNRE
jgi:hypothetical protein